MYHAQLTTQSLLTTMQQKATQILILLTMSFIRQSESQLQAGCVDYGVSADFKLTCHFTKTIDILRIQYHRAKVVSTCVAGAPSEPDFCMDGAAETAADVRAHCLGRHECVIALGYPNSHQCEPLLIGRPVTIVIYYECVRRRVVTTLNPFYWATLHTTTHYGMTEPTTWPVYADDDEDFPQTGVIVGVVVGIVVVIAAVLVAVLTYRRVRSKKMVASTARTSVPDVVSAPRAYDNTYDTKYRDDNSDAPIGCHNTETGVYYEIPDESLDPIGGHTGHGWKVKALEKGKAMPHIYQNELVPRDGASQAGRNMDHIQKELLSPNQKVSATDVPDVHLPIFDDVIYEPFGDKPKTIKTPPAAPLRVTYNSVNDKHIYDNSAGNSVIPYSTSGEADSHKLPADTNGAHDSKSNTTPELNEPLSHVWKSQPSTSSAAAGIEPLSPAWNAQPSTSSATANMEPRYVGAVKDTDETLIIENELYCRS